VKSRDGSEHKKRLEIFESDKLPAEYASAESPWQRTFMRLLSRRGETDILASHSYNFFLISWSVDGFIVILTIICQLHRLYIIRLRNGYE
jgi:hypothetical protein